ncbi:MAG: FAD-binding oxidoreductase [Solirubrobacterales bacterium]
MTSAAPRRDTKWWGWGDPAHEASIDAGSLALLREELGDLEAWGRPGAVDEVPIPDAEPLPRVISEIVGEANVVAGHEDRFRHSTGGGYADLVRRRSGRLDEAPDAVVLPGDGAELGAVLQACAGEGVAVVPFGGGTSVVGGVEPLRGEHPRLISLDLARLRGMSVDRTSLTSTLGAGLRGPEAEEALRAQGLTLGHFPQSFEYASIGGFAATRSAGQASSGFGRFDEIVTGLRMLAPAGELRTLETPHTAAGPSLRELAIGSEGVLGVIPEVTVRVRPAARSERYEAWIAESWEAGCAIVRELAQDEALPDVIRVSDRQETRFSLALSGPGGLAGALFDRYLSLRGRAGGCLVVVGVEGERERVARRRSQVARRLRAGGAVYLGQGGGRAWKRGRYEGPYLRDALMDAGAMVETLETSHTWSRLEELYGAVQVAIGNAMKAQGTPGIVLCHLSHAYPDGASLYYTFLARRLPGKELEQWRAVKSAACDAIVAAGGTITHHHAVGRDHVPYMRDEVGELGLEVLRSAKQRLDPTGILNPGKLIG